MCLCPACGFFLFVLGSHHPSSCRLHMYIEMGQTAVDLGTPQHRTGPRCNTHAGQYVLYVLTHLHIYTIYVPYMLWPRVMEV